MIGWPTEGWVHRLRLPPSASFRLGLVVLCAFLAAVRSEARALAWIVAFTSIALALSLRPLSRRWLMASLVTESVLAAAAVVDTGGSDSPLLPYLLAPAFESGMAVGLVGAVVVPVVAATVLALGRWLDEVGDTPREYTVAAVEWILIATAVGLITTWARRLRLTPPSEPTGDSYVAAYRLLAQLRTVARQLSAGLDAAAVAQGLLNDLRAIFGFEHAAVLVRGSGDLLMPLVHAGTERVAWNASLNRDTPFAEAWMTQQPQWQPRPLSGKTDGPCTSIVLPLRFGVRTFGLVVIQRQGVTPPTTAELNAAQRTSDEVALRLETALLFNEVREIATVEERRRVAREIHDGIAQELASLGYFVDSLVAQAARQQPVEEDLARLRQELTRIISEIRLSIFDLRSDVDQYGGLGAALSEYVRSVGTSSRMTVHLSLDESGARLPVDVEAELLRIAQEAITNARKHAAAENLWVTVTVDPPRASLCVEDDGVGLQPGRDDSFGLDIMRERAASLRGNLRISPRDPRGTVVEVVIGEKAGADAASAGRRG